MKIAIPVADGRLCAHFGHCQQFALIEVNPETKEVAPAEYLTPPPHEPGVLPAWLAQQGATIILAGGMGMRAQQMFVQNGIRVIVGVQNDDPPEKLVEHLVAESLQIGDNLCDH